MFVKIRDLSFSSLTICFLFKVSNGFLQLTPLQLLARDIIVLLQENGLQIPLNSLGNTFQQKYEKPLSASNFGFQNLSSLLEHFSDYFFLKGKKQKRLVCLNSEAIGKYFLCYFSFISFFNNI